VIDQASAHTHDVPGAPASSGTVDLDVAALLCTRLCHDLAGPIGAVTAGAELMADETDPSFLGETVALLQHSAEAASAKLKFLRATFGVAGRGAVSAPQAMALAYVDAIGGASMSLEWQAEPHDLAAPEAGQLALNLVLAALDCLRGRGAVRLETGRDGERLWLTAAAAGKGAGLDSDGRSALAGTAAGLTPRTVQLYLLGRLAAIAHGRLDLTEEVDSVRFKVSVPMPETAAG
jgi:histidine phosphotransferase ChpT